jgi:hypothetical protein
MCRGLTRPETDDWLYFALLYIDNGVRRSPKSLCAGLSRYKALLYVAGIMSGRYVVVLGETVLYCSVLA